VSHNLEASKKVGGSFILAVRKKYRKVLMCGVLDWRLTEVEITAKRNGFWA